MGVMNAWTTARWAGMGGTGIAAANDAAAIDFNPANLPHMQFDSVDMGGPLTWGGTATYGGGDFDDMSLKIGTVSNEGNWGAGFSYERASDSGWHDTILSLGYGAICGPRSSWGISATRDEMSGRSETWINAGALYAIPHSQGAPIKVGLIVSNILEDDNDPRFYNLGLAVPVGEKLLLAVDYWDITDKWSKQWNFGAELTVAPEWRVRLGQLDEDWTGGAGYRKDKLSLDAAYIDYPWDSMWLVSGSTPF